jgi:hypothetical protein
MKRLTMVVIMLHLVLGGLSGCSPIETGNDNPPPGGGPLVSFQDHIELELGETKSTDITLMIRRPDGPTNVSYGIFRAEKAEDYTPPKGGAPYEKLPMPQGLDISIKPDEFVAYPNQPYHSTIVIKASPELAKGEYQLFLEVSFDDSRWPGSGWITVNVK